MAARGPLIADIGFGLKVECFFDGSPRFVRIFDDAFGQRLALNEDQARALYDALGRIIEAQDKQDREALYGGR